VNGSPPRVTVVIPTYSWATVLPYSIGSVLEQTFTDLELLVIGDCCTDESEAVVTSFTDPRVQWFNLPEPTRHQVGPDNEGIRRARGDIVAYLGHDDLWLPRHLELLVAAIDNGAVFAHGRQLRVVPGEPPRVLPPRGWSYRRGARIPPTSMAHAREAVPHVGGWRMPAETGQRDPEDELWMRMFDAFGKPALVPLVTSIKFPAAERPNVYRERPHHEQAEWRERIRATDEPERAFLDTYARRSFVSTRIGWTVGKAVTRVARRTPARPPALDRYHATRRRKGLDD